MAEHREDQGLGDGAAKAPRVELRRYSNLSPAHADEVLTLAAAAQHTDRADPLSDDVRLDIHGTSARHTASDSRNQQHVLAYQGARLVGYLHLRAETSEPSTLGPSSTHDHGPQAINAALVVHPGARQRGIGRELAETAVHRAAGQLRIWAHGDHPGAAALAHTLGARRSRVLLILGRSLVDEGTHQTASPGANAPLAQDLREKPVLPTGISVRPFHIGHDEPAVLAVNARAFVRLPDQGGWTINDFVARENEPWFDPDGFLLAVRKSSGEILGFHWTKIHPAGSHTGPDLGQSLGEVYVLAVDPAAHGSGLGKALTQLGLRYLASRSIAQVMLYVDASNTAAVALYRKLGFTQWTNDVEYTIDSVRAP